MLPGAWSAPSFLQTFVNKIETCQELRTTGTMPETKRISIYLGYASIQTASKLILIYNIHYVNTQNATLDTARGTVNAGIIYDTASIALTVLDVRSCSFPDDQNLYLPCERTLDKVPSPHGRKYQYISLGSITLAK